MLRVVKANERGNANHGWLQSKHTFSFADYYNPEFMGFSKLRVINEDRIVGGSGFATHGHQNMEIVSYVIDGALEHKDSMGNSTTIKTNEVQRMSAGTGVRHSEYNFHKDKTTHFLQIWILPDQQGISPSYGQKDFSSALSTGELSLVVSNHGRDGSISINQDVDIYALKSKSGGEKILNTDEGRSYWLQVINGTLKVNDIPLGPGDALAGTLLTRIHMAWLPNSEFLLFDLPG